MSTFNKDELRKIIEEYLHYNPEKRKMFPVGPATVHNFYECFMDGTYNLLATVNPEVIRSFTVDVVALKHLLEEAPNAKYLKITITQIPLNYTQGSAEMNRHAGNLYFLFTMANSSTTDNLTPYYDLNAFNTQTCYLESSMVDQLMSEFHNTSNPHSLRAAMLNRCSDNTEHIYVHRDKLMNEYLPYMENLGMVRILFVFCEIDSEDTQAIADGRKAIIENNHEHFGILWKGLNLSNQVIEDAPVYDFNELCPNQCPQ
ncbi:MAG: hypothetical protein JNM95_10090 [Chitinophagaceae bacterium]|nr:hypothetical protein [Chitinophagaceae bacterium]